MTEHIPLLTIVTPNFNGEKFIEETLLSVIKQKTKDVEYIVIDANSNDRSMEIINKYRDKIDIIISEPDKGQADAINKGMKLAKGKFVAYLNSDDVYMPNTIGKVISLIKKNPGMRAVYGDNLNLFPDNTLNARPKISWDFKICLNYLLMIPQPASFWEKNLMVEHNYFDDTMNDTFDYDFFLRAFKNLTDDEILHVRDLFVIFRHHEAAKTTNNQANIKKENKLSRLKHKEFISNQFLRFFIKRYYMIKAVHRYILERGLLILRPFR
jgi:glycosyltransferase involved in cell wall biosynthesis